MNPFGLCGVLLHILCNYFMTKGVFFICDALLDVDHFFLGQRAARHGDQGDDPAQHRQTVLDGKGHPEDAAGVGIRGLGHGGGVTQKGDRTGGDDSSHRGDELIDQAVSAGDNRRDVTAAAVQLVVDGISHVELLEVVMHMLEPFCSRVSRT